MPKYDVYMEVTNQIIEALEQGVKPWECPWQKNAAALPLRVTGDSYRGINHVLLNLKAWTQGYRNPVWMTFKQAKDLGGMVRKGEKSSLVVKYGTFEAKDEAREGETKDKTRGYLKAYRVFNVQQIDGLDDQFPTPDEAEPLATRPIEQLSHIAANMVESMGVGYAEGGDRACYVPSLDKVHMPELPKFKAAELFYSTLFHELSHATGHKRRCDRTKDKAGSKFGNAVYAMEELVAEISSAMVGAQLDFQPGHIEDSAAYVQSWLKMLRDDKRAIVKAAAAAQRSADYLMEKA
ncbi:MAG: zincin-like metallopeptidase domain-containing protein [Sulfitobacter sp.]